MATEMAHPRVLILSGYGLNCEEETKFAFDRAGGIAEIIHINDLIEYKKKFLKYQILAIPGGFSYGDDTGSGKAYANRIKNNLGNELQNFVTRGNLVIGICNGFQVLTNLGLLPGALTFNQGGRFLDRWVDLAFSGNSPWTRSVRPFSLPIAHGEGKFVADPKALAALRREGAVAATYIKGEICAYQDLAPNPNGSLADIAGVLAYEGRVFGLMPHPERAMFFLQLPHWPLLKEKSKRAGKRIPEEAAGLQIFRNGVSYFSR